MKRLLLTVCLVLALSVGARADISFNGGGGGGGGGGPALTFDPTIQTNSGVTGVKYTPEQYGAKGDVVVFRAGAMDNNVTANLTDTTNAPFTGRAGELICVNGTSATTVTDGNGTRHVETCGTISSVTSSSVAVLSFNNASGAAISGVSYVMGANDTTALTNAETAACNAGGGTITLASLYGMNAQISLCPTATVNWKGQNRNFYIQQQSGGITTYPSKLQSGVWAITKSMTAGTSAFSAVSATGTTNNTAMNMHFSNMLIAAGVGANYDGGCSTCNGIAFQNWIGLTLDTDQIEGWGQFGLYIDGNGTTATDFTAVVNVTNSQIFQNVTGIQIGGAFTPGAGLNPFLQNININGASQILQNFHNGVGVGHDVHTLNIQGGNILQDNDEAGANGFADVNLNTTTTGAPNCYDCSITDNYFQLDEASETGLSQFPVGAVAHGPLISSNFFTASQATNQGIFLGNGFNTPNQPVYAARVSDNYFNTFTSGKELIFANTLGCLQSSVVMNNISTATTFDAMDMYANTGCATIASSAVYGGTVAASQFKTTTALVALGGGAAPTLGTIGGSGPATAAQNTWLKMTDSTGASFWVPVWK